jgi:hypothetical protein
MMPKTDSNCYFAVRHPRAKLAERLIRSKLWSSVDREAEV